MLTFLYAPRSLSDVLKIIYYDDDSRAKNEKRLNKRAVVGIKRGIDKVDGRDFNKSITLDLSQQVELLILEATSPKFSK